jgi:hypothetical protein
MACFLGRRAVTAATRVEVAWLRVRPTRMMVQGQAQGPPRVQARALAMALVGRSARAHRVTVA